MLGLPASVKAPALAATGGCATYSTLIFTTKVWLTGGAFIMGGGSWFGPDYWMIHNIILVKIEIIFMEAFFKAQRSMLTV